MEADKVGRVMNHKELLAATLAENEKLWAERGEGLMPYWIKATPEGQRLIAEFESLRTRLSAAEMVVEAARTFRNRCPKHPFEEGEVPCTCGRQELDAALAAYPPKPASEQGQNERTT